MLFERLQFCQSSMCNVNIKLFLTELPKCPTTRKLIYLIWLFESYLDKLKVLRILDFE